MNVYSNVIYSSPKWGGGSPVFTNRGRAGQIAVSSYCLSTIKGDNYRCIPKAVVSKRKQRALYCVFGLPEAQRDIIDPWGEKSGLLIASGIEIDWKELCAG